MNGILNKMSFLRISTSYLKSKPLRANFSTKIALTADKSTIVALHKENEFPYELSQPLPEETNEDKSVLRMSDYSEVKRVFKEMKPEFARQQLSSMTLTTTHRWFPRSRDKRAKTTEMNRPYL